MKKIQKLFDTLNTSKSFRERYPHYNRNDGKIHLLFISPCMNESGLHRMILPALELNQSYTHSAIIANIHRWDFNKQFDDYDNPIDFQLVTWADYVILPPLFTDAKYIIKSMRAFNPDLDFVMDMDCIYHELPTDHPASKKLTEQSKHTLLHNLSLVDIVTAPNNAILDYYNYLCHESQDEFTYYQAQYPVRLSNFTYGNTLAIKRNNSEVVRIGVLMDDTPVQDLQLILPPIQMILKKYGDKVQFILYGWSNKAGALFNLFDNAAVTYIPPVNTFSRPARLNELAIDFGLIPYRNIPFNQSVGALSKYLDFSSLAVPSVLSGLPVYDSLITEGEHALIARHNEDWRKHLETLIENKDLRRSMGQAAFEMCWQKLSYTTAQSLQRLKDIFI